MAALSFGSYDIDSADQGNLSTCAECGDVSHWGGMGWTRHTEQYHEMVRRRLLLKVSILLWEYRGFQRGHRYTIHFTRTSAWPVCPCGWVGESFPTSTQASWYGHLHVMIEGRDGE